jgi:hypothetical protein
VIASAAVSSRFIAFVIPHPYVDALACFREPIKLLASQGWRVDLYTTLSPIHPAPFFATENVRLVPFEMSRGGAIGLVRALVGQRPKYRWLLTVPQWGLHYGTLAARLAGIPVGCISDELKASAEATTDDQKRWKARERRAHRRCRFTIALSPPRADFIRTENGLDSNHRVLIVPNAAPGPSVHRRSRYYQDTLGLQGDARVLLHSGSLWWPAAREFVEAARAWTSEWVVVFQVRLAAHPELRVDSARVLFADQVLPASLLDYATSSATIGLALYDTSTVNNRLMGTASGKVALYMKNALPVIATRGSGLEWIEDERCGICVSSVGEIRQAADRIWAEYDRYVLNVRRCYDASLDFTTCFQPVVEMLGT